MRRVTSGGTGTVMSLAAAGALWIALAASPPILRAVGWEHAAVWVRLVFHPLCHQDPARSFILFDSAMALCARCTGLYSGFLAGAAWLLVRAVRRGSIPAPPRARGLILAAVPSIIQWLLSAAGLAADHAKARAVTGAVLGFTVAFYFVYSVHHMRGELAAELRRLFAPGGRVDAETS